MDTKLRSNHIAGWKGLVLPVLFKLVGMALLAGVVLVLSTCTIVLSAEVGGTSSGTGGVLDPMLAIFEEELLAAFDTSRSLLPLSSESVVDAPSREIGTPASRGLAGGANSIKHGLPSTTVAQVRARVRETIVAQGLEKSRDLEKVAPAIASATAEALVDTDLVGTEIATTDLARINAITSKAIARSLNAPSVTALAEGLGTESEKRARLDALARAAVDNVDTLGLPAADLDESLHMVVLLVTSAGNADLSSSGTGDNDPGILLTARTGSLVKIAGAKLDGRLTGSDCSAALNDLANAAVVGLGDTAIRDLAETKLQAVVQDGVLFNLFMAYYGFKTDVGLSATDLRGAIDFGEAITAIGTSEFASVVADEIQAERTTIVPAADTKARTAAIITTINPPVNELAGATEALPIAEGNSSTWTRGSTIRVVGNLAINGNLTIEPGVTVYIDNGYNITVGVNGSINAVGTADEPITFTRAVAGVEWGSLEISGNSPMNQLAYCNVSGAINGIIIAHYSSTQGIAVIDNCIVHDNRRHGIYAEFARRDGTRMTTITNCYLYDNLLGNLVINESVALDSESPNYFHDPLSADGPDLADPANRIRFLGNFTLPVTLDVTEVPYFIPDSTLVEVSGKLELLAGVTIEFGSESYMRVNTGGSLQAVGTETDPVVFTGAEKISGYWRGLQFHDSNSVSNQLDHVIIEYGGGGAAFAYAETRANLVLTKNSSTSRIRISNSTLRHSGRYGLYLDPALAIDLFEANTCTANTAGAAYIDANAIHLLDADSDYSGNTIDVIALDETTITTSQTWKDLGVPYRQISIDGRIEVASGANLTLDPGVTVEFAQGARLYVNGTGSLTVSGTDLEPVLLTGQQKQSGYWRGVYFYNSQSMQNSLSFATVEYAGSSAHAYAEVAAGLTLAFNASSGIGTGLAIQNCTFQNNSGYGIFIDPAVELRNFSGNTISGNASGAVFAYVDNIAMFTSTTTYIGNTIDRVYIYASTPIASETTWHTLDVPYQIGPDNAELTVNSGLTIEAGNRLIFGYGTGLRINTAGYLKGLGTSDNPILFTGSTSQAGHWKGIWFYRAPLTQNALAFATVEYGGHSPWTFATMSSNIAIVTYGALYPSYASITNSTIRDGLGAGIWLDTEATYNADIATSNTFSDLVGVDVYINP